MTCSGPGPVAVAAFTGWYAAHGRTALPVSPETVAAFLAPDAGRGFAVNTLRLCYAALHYLHLLVGNQRSKALNISNVERQQTLHVVIKHRRDDGGVVHLTAGGATCREDCVTAVQSPAPYRPA
jgi:hypothetical protein